MNYRDEIDKANGRVGLMWAVILSILVVVGVTSYIKSHPHANTNPAQLKADQVCDKLYNTKAVMLNQSDPTVYICLPNHVEGIKQQRYYGTNLPRRIDVVMLEDRNPF